MDQVNIVDTGIVFMNKMKTLEQLGHLSVFFINLLNDLEARPISMVKSTHIIKTSWTKSTIKP